MIVQVLQVFQFDVEFEVTVAFRNLVHELGNICLEVNQKVGWLDKVDHRIIDVEITLVVAVVDVAAGMEVCREYVRIFIDRAVLHDRAGTLANLSHLVESTIEEIYLQMEGPARHVAVKIS